MKIYIASPYSIPEGKQLENVYKSFEVFDRLLKLGYTPYCPLVSHFIHEKFPQNYDDWIDYDLEWLAVCDGLLRLPGESKGADIEVKKAKELNVKIFYSIEDLIKNTINNKNKEKTCKKTKTMIL